MLPGSIRSQVYVLLLARNVAGPDFREDTYFGHLELAYLIRARTRSACQAVESHLAAGYARVRASYSERAGPLISARAKPRFCCLRAARGRF